MHFRSSIHSITHLVMPLTETTCIYAANRDLNSAQCLLLLYAAHVKYGCCLSAIVVAAATVFCCCFSAEFWHLIKLCSNYPSREKESCTHTQQQQTLPPPLSLSVARAHDGRRAWPKTQQQQSQQQQTEQQQQQKQLHTSYGVSEAARPGYITQNRLPPKGKASSVYGCSGRAHKIKGARASAGGRQTVLKMPEQTTTTAAAAAATTSSSSDNPLKRLSLSSRE